MATTAGIPPPPGADCHVRADGRGVRPVSAVGPQTQFLLCRPGFVDHPRRFARLDRRQKIHPVYLYALPMLVIGQTVVIYTIGRELSYWLRIAHAILG